MPGRVTRLQFQYICLYPDSRKVTRLVGLESFASMSSLQDFGLAAWLIAIFLTLSTTAQSWKHYPLVLETDPPITFPQIEGAQYQDMGDSWFMTAQVTGETTGKKYQIVNIFDRNYITLAILNFYQVRPAHPPWERKAD